MAELQQMTPREETARALVDALYRLLRLTHDHGSADERSRDAAGLLGSFLERLDAPLALRFIQGSVWQGNDLLALNEQEQGQAAAVGRAFAEMNIHEVVFSARPPMDQVIEFGEALSMGSTGLATGLDGVRIRGIEWRRLPALITENPPAWAPEAFAAARLQVALSEAARLPRGEDDGWDWRAGLSVIRRIERALAVETAAVQRSLEITADAWTAPGRAVSAVARCFMALQAVGARRSTSRAAAHFLLAVCSHGLSDAGAKPLTTVCEQLSVLLKSSFSPETDEDTSHQVRVRSLAALLSLDPARAVTSPLASLVRTLYELEAARAETGATPAPTFTDLLALAHLDDGRRFDPDWINVLAHHSGPYPPGTRVRLPDGRLGIILDPSDPEKITVLAAGEVLTTKPPLRPTAPGA